MKILMFSADPNILDKDSAAAKRVGEYAKRLERLDVVVLARKIPGKIHGNNQGNLFVYAKGGIFWRFFSGFFLAWRLIAKNKHNLLVAQDIEHAKICWLLSLRFGTPWQMQIHADIFIPFFIRHSVFNKMRATLAKFLIPRASCIRVVSERIRRSIPSPQPQAPGPKVVVLPILAESADLNIEPKRFPEFSKTILMVSRLTSEKNIGLALDAMAEVVKKHPKTGLIIVGDGPERKALEIKSKNYQLTANIRFEGWQKNTASYYKGADVFLLTSLYEGWGVSVVEAMQYGAAVIMTDVGLAGELIEDGKNGLIVSVGDKNALIGAILRILENDELRGGLIEEAVKKTRGLPSAEEYYQKIVESWQKC